MNQIDSLLLVIAILLFPMFIEYGNIVIKRTIRNIKVLLLLKELKIGDVYIRKNVDKYLKRRTSYSRNFGILSKDLIYLKIFEISPKNEEVYFFYSDKLETLSQSNDDSSYDLETFNELFEKSAGTLAEDTLEKIINK
jgi:hypothetical protein